MILAFVTGLGQVFFVALQQRQIALGASMNRIVLVGVIISAIWIFNVHAALGDFWTGAAYVVGAGSGTWLAMQIRLTTKGYSKGASC